MINKPETGRHTFISLLRGVNVSGQNMIRMADLKKLYEGLGFGRVESYLQSGNMRFEAQEGDEQQLAERIQAQIKAELGCTVPVLIRRPDELQRLVDNNPFLARQEDPVRLYVTFLHSVPAAEALARLQVPAGEPGEFAAAGREIYLFLPSGYGRTKLSNTFFENKLKVTATSRNWNSVQALLALTRS